MASAACLLPSHHSTVHYTVVQYVITCYTVRTDYCYESHWIVDGMGRDWMVPHAHSLSVIDNSTRSRLSTRSRRRESDTVTIGYESNVMYVIYSNMYNAAGARTRLVRRFCSSSHSGRRRRICRYQQSIRLLAIRIRLARHPAASARASNRCFFCCYCRCHR